ncbi:hypothetical protein BROUX41_005777 [Berkeleyomyces rouxiae]|uniref:uncharacterized protein n=1 Tax=Berkeleyomyces rouxiae TaxID=2035830 RepID=UPI003B7CAF39
MTLLLFLLFPVAVYLIFLILGSLPLLQKQFLYAHKINTLLWNDLDAPETWGFAHNQATPLRIPTPDGQSLYAWHILPLSLYSTNELAIAGRDSQSRPTDITKSESLNLLKQDKHKKVVICFHGNAGHLANSWRPQTYHALATSSDYHVIAFDYRGFGLSTGSPSEQGLITDACAVIDWVMNVAQVPHENIALYGHSLGTAVLSGALEHYTQEGIVFAGVLLVAPFTSMPTLLSGYRILGTFPVLGPLHRFPALQQYIHNFIWEKWPTMDRLVRIVRTSPPGLRITLLHALDDCDIPHTETNTIFHAMASASSPDAVNNDSFEQHLSEATTELGNGGSITTWKGESDVLIRRVMFPYGGHNLITTYAPTLQAIRRFYVD